ncbi:MAG: permease [Chloroflexi bacterium]|nr:permease [Chloroflexota bacterium]
MTVARDVSAVRPASDAGRHLEYLRGIGLLLLIAVVGLFIVKWQPYYLRAFAAAANHTLGASIVTGTAAAPPAASLQAAFDYSLAYFKAIWQAMLLGLLLAATIESSLPRDLLVRLLGAASARSSLVGGLLSLPGMMCTCCTAPVAIGLRRSGASLGSSVAFFLGNPTLNPAVLVFLLFTLGPAWALLRLVLGLVLVIGAVYLATRYGGSSSPTSVVTPPAMAAPSGAWGMRWLRSFGRLVIQLVPEYIIVVGLLGFARAFLFPAASPDLGNDLLLMVGLALAGTLFVIPTAGEIPIIQTMLGFGIGSGPAGVLLMTLAPLSLPSLLMVAKAFPWRVTVLLAVLTAAVGLLSGLLAVALGL